MCDLLRRNTYGFQNALLSFMYKGENYAKLVIKSIENEFINSANGSYDAHDPFAFFSDAVLKEPRFSFTVKELAAEILNYISRDVNRFRAENLIGSLIESGLDPIIEGILTN